MPVGLSPRDRRTALAGFVAVALLCVTRGVPAMTKWERTQLTEASHISEEMAGVEAGQHGLVKWRDSLRVRQARLTAFDTVLLTGRTPADAAAVLASAVGAHADDARIRINTTQLRADTSIEGQHVQVTVRVSAVGDIYGLTAFLRDVDSDAALLRVRELTVSQNEPTAPTGRPEMLRIEALIESVVRLTGARPR